MFQSKIDRNVFWRFLKNYKITKFSLLVLSKENVNSLIISLDNDILEKYYELVFIY